MSQHTKGPWHAGELPVDDDRAKNLPSIFIWDQDETSFIASVCDEDNEGQATQANARLIAAAPELLEAARLVLDEWDRAGRNGCDETYKMLASAIAKAVSP